MDNGMDKSGITIFVDEFIGCKENTGAPENPRILNSSQHNSSMSSVTNENQNPNFLRQTISVSDSSTQTLLTPSQRRLSNVNLSDRGLQVLPKYNLKHNITQIDSRIIESSESAKRKENRKFISVTVPQLEHLGVKRPVWYPQSSSHVINNTYFQKSANVESSSSGVKNLLLEFNDADEDLNEKDHIVDYILDPDNQVYENVVSDGEVDEEAAHRGEYLSDDEADKEPQLPVTTNINFSI
ncbi:hypothetical protein POM88_039006 [Heracleum sosnowskyi]|uniref:Uncharacterized protein n=1 Tax=Heracleum sosnowskyi TaxID=360622 RepID=A0AAD8HCC1_9APIA|nr:hypothetical protein POM88_039006 [Heracleum sosnowskyi]